MLIDIIPTLKELNPKKIYGKTVIVLDIFRCTSTIVTALANGCKEVIPAGSPEEAVSISSGFPKKSVIIAGESSGEKLPGFILGNSPLEFSGRIVRGKTVILATTNGTKAIRMSKPAKHVLLGSFLNVEPVSLTALGFQKDITIVCAGTRGNISLEDIMAAGCHVKAIKKYCQDLRLSELGKTFYYLFNYFEDQLKQLLSTSRSGLNLQKLGYEKDIDFCLEQNKYRVVPVFKNNSVTLTQSSQLAVEPS